MIGIGASSTSGARRGPERCGPVVLAPWHWRLDWQLWIAACKGQNGTNDGGSSPLLLKLLETTPGDKPSVTFPRRTSFLDTEAADARARVAVRHAFVEPDNGNGVGRRRWHTREPRAF